MGIRVGIDLGTTFSAIAKIDTVSGKPEIIKNSFGLAVTPSVLCFQEDGTILFGEDAKNMQAAGDTNTIAFFKRSMGKEQFSIDFFGNSYSATDLSAIFLEKLKEEAESQIHEPIDAAVITVPAYFSHKEREATIEAGRKAGVEVIATINEPTAAAFAYGLKRTGTEQKILIYDLGGGTFDATIAQISDKEICVLGSDGDHELGGKDWDDCLARYLATQFFETYGQDLTEDPEIAASLLVTAESVKKQLSAKTRVTVPLAYKGVRGAIEITEETFESISEFLMGTTKDVTNRLLESLEMTWNDIDGVILVGGSTRMPMVRKYVETMSGKKTLGGVNVDEAVALGAAIRANITEKGEALLNIGGKKGKEQELNTGLSIQGAKAVMDVTAHSLGMISESEDREHYINKIIIPKNIRIPAQNTVPFAFRTRAAGNELEIYVLQGEFEEPMENTVIHKYVVKDIEKVDGGRSIIEVTYAYSANGIIEVSAVQKETGNVLPIQIEPVPEDMSWVQHSPKENMENGDVQPAKILLAVDLSGSMYGDPIEKAMEAMRDFTDQMEANGAMVGIIAFADRTELVLEPTDDYRLVHGKIQELPSIDVGGGNNAEPFTLAYDILRTSEINEPQYMVVLTDGQWYNITAAIQGAKTCHAAGIEVMTLGFGRADYDFLKKIASIEEFAEMTDLKGLSGSFSKIAQVIGEATGNLKIR